MWLYRSMSHVGAAWGKGTGWMGMLASRRRCQGALDSSLRPPDCDAVARNDGKGGGSVVREAEDSSLHGGGLGGSRSAPTPVWVVVCVHGVRVWDASGCWEGGDVRGSPPPRDCHAPIIGARNDERGGFAPRGKGGRCGTPLQGWDAVARNDGGNVHAPRRFDCDAVARNDERGG